MPLQEVTLPEALLRVLCQWHVLHQLLVCGLPKHQGQCRGGHDQAPVYQATGPGGGWQWQLSIIGNVQPERMLCLGLVTA